MVGSHLLTRPFPLSYVLFAQRSVLHKALVVVCSSQGWLFAHHCRSAHTPCSAHQKRGPVPLLLQVLAACRVAFAARRPALIDIALDPMAGVESGNVHGFNRLDAAAAAMNGPETQAKAKL